MHDVAELKAFKANFRSEIHYDAEPNALGGWSYTDPAAARPSPRRCPSPCPLPRVQHALGAAGVLRAAAGRRGGRCLEGTVKVARQRLNHRLLWVSVTLVHTRPGIGQMERNLNYRLDQMPRLVDLKGDRAGHRVRRHTYYTVYTVLRFIQRPCVSRRRPSGAHANCRFPAVYHGRTVHGGDEV